MATFWHYRQYRHSSILAWRIPGTEEPGAWSQERHIESMGSQRVGHDWVTNTHTHTHTHRILIQETLIAQRISIRNSGIYEDDLGPDSILKDLLSKKTVEVLPWARRRGWRKKVKMLITQPCLTLCNPVDCSPPGSSVHGILQARILEWVAITFSRGSFWPRNQSQVSCIAGRFFTVWATREAPGPYGGDSSVQFSHSVMSDSLRPHELQHARPPCPSPTPRVHPDSRPSSQWCHPAISSSVVPFSSCPQSLPASESFPMSQLFT